MAALQEHGSARRVTLPARCLVGRAPACDLVLSEKTVSGQHAVVQWTGTEWEVRDLGSRNGTYVDDNRLASGVGCVLGPGVRLRFGRDAASWELVDAAGPELMAVHLETGAIQRAEGGYLALPDSHAADHCIYQESSGAWVVEQRGELRPLDDRAVLVTADAARWRIHLPTTLAGTLKESEATLIVAALRLRFTVSLDEEHVELVAVCGDHRLDLQARAHHYPLLVLARQRLADAAGGLPEGEQGWVRQEELARMLRMDDNHLNISIHRARTQLGKLGVLDAASLVERRSGSRQLRIGARRIEIAAP